MSLVNISRYLEHLKWIAVLIQIKNKEVCKHDYVKARLTRKCKLTSKKEILEKEICTSIIFTNIKKVIYFWFSYLFKILIMFDLLTFKIIVLIPRFR